MSPFQFPFYQLDIYIPELGTCCVTRLLKIDPNVFLWNVHMKTNVKSFTK